MKHKILLRLIYVSLILVVLIAPLFVNSVPVLAADPTIQENLNTGGDGDSTAIYGQAWEAMQFTSSASAHTVTKIVLTLKRVGSPSTIDVSIRTAAAGVPNSTNDYITFDSYNGNNLGTSYSPITFNVSSTSPHNSLLASTQYAIVLRTANGGGGASDYVMWQIDTGGGLANAVATKSINSGSAWVAETTATSDALFEVYGSSAMSIVSAKEFDSYLVTGDMLFVFEYINTYPPYYENKAIPSNYFYFQLRDTTNTNIIAQTTMKAWGDRPGSIYLGSGVVSTITKGSGLWIRMVDTTGTIYTQYQLTGADWLGDASPLSTHTTNFLLNVFDKITGQDQVSKLDDWVRGTAKSIDAYNYANFGTTTSLLKYLQNKGEVLAANTEGDSIFVLGIPSLNYVRPNLFEVVSAELPITTTTWTNAYNNLPNPTFDTIVGATISGDMNALGTLFGVTATAAVGTEPAIPVSQKTMGTLLMIVAVLLALFGLMAVGSGFAPVSLFLSMPIMFWGAQIRAIDIRLIGLIIFILFILCIRRFVWVEG